LLECWTIRLILTSVKIHSQGYDDGSERVLELIPAVFMNKLGHQVHAVNFQSSDSELCITAASECV
jgi:hypothetical protein